MALMKYREPNQVLWQGSRPAHNGTQVILSLNRNVVNTYYMYQVPVGQTFFLTYGGLFTVPGVANRAWFGLSDAVPVVQWYAAFLDNQANYNNYTWSQNFWPPIEVPATWYVTFDINAAVSTVGTMAGWVE